MMLWRRTTTCERAAQWMSLELDGELSELESARLARHLESCSSCRAWSADVAGFTTMLRAAPLLEPSQIHAFELPVRRRRRAGAAALAAVAAVAAVVVAIPQGSRNSSTGALGFRDAQQQQRFAQEHVRTELAVFAVPPEPPPTSFASRALL
jgi:predicted anti-sigma-YlaC factor YlaD